MAWVAAMAQVNRWPGNFYMPQVWPEVQNKKMKGWEAPVENLKVQEKAKHRRCCVLLSICDFTLVVLPF